nr:DUF1848 domain-containing protein [uncultured Niameybacter sp.]
MIVSVSRRTDIPAFYSEWFAKRLVEGYVLIKNPFNRKQVSKVLLTPEHVECFVFWTKDPEPIMKYLDLLEPYAYYFQITINAYGEDLEPNVRKKQQIINTVKALSQKIGSERIVWRYDPILLNPYYSKAYHYKWFEEIAKKLEGITKKCVISFVDEYKETKRNAKILNQQPISTEDMQEIGKTLAKIAGKYGMQVETCAEKIDLSLYGIEHGQCIDPQLIARITGLSAEKFKRDNMRQDCGCVKSVDIGEYNSCLHECAYCYANYNHGTILQNKERHDMQAPLLIGQLNGDEKITTHHLCKEKKGCQLNLLGEDM